MSASWMIPLAIISFSSLLFPQLNTKSQLPTTTTTITTTNFKASNFSAACQANMNKLEANQTYMKAVNAYIYNEIPPCLRRQAGKTSIDCRGDSNHTFRDACTGTGVANPCNFKTKESALSVTISLLQYICWPKNCTDADKNVLFEAAKAQCEDQSISVTCSFSISCGSFPIWAIIVITVAGVALVGLIGFFIFKKSAHAGYTPL